MLFEQKTVGMGYPKLNACGEHVRPFCGNDRRSKNQCYWKPRCVFNRKRNELIYMSWTPARIVLRDTWQYGMNTNTLVWSE